MYNFFDLSSIKGEEWDKIYRFCVDKSNLFKSRALSRSTDFFSDLKSKDINIFNEFEYISRIDLNDMSTTELKGNHENIEKIKEILNYLCEVDSFFRFTIPDTSDFQPIKELFSNIKGVKILPVCSLEFYKKDSFVDYLSIAGDFTKECKELLCSIGILDKLQSYTLHSWDFYIIEKKIWRPLTSIGVNYFVVSLTEKELSILRDKKLILGTVSKIPADFSSIRCKVNEVTRNLIYNAPLYSIYLDFDSEKSYFSNIELYDEDREILFLGHNGDFKDLCLTDDELNELKSVHNINTEKWQLIKRTDIYEPIFDWSSEFSKR
ncbi:hypothetical protein [Desnuesiella massiliensis]|uniref:hypothetical protein n=1 Tax=Desnuesiella massiliensis TaxID=1650662 RepID=UPI0006E30999|nr:hypothetical protein [Desnuesiella massiliensis]